MYCRYTRTLGQPPLSSRKACQGHNTKSGRGHKGKRHVTTEAVESHTAHVGPAPESGPVDLVGNCRDGVGQPQEGARRQVRPRQQVRAGRRRLALQGGLAGRERARVHLVELALLLAGLVHGAAGLQLHRHRPDGLVLLVGLLRGEVLVGAAPAKVGEGHQLLGDVDALLVHALARGEARLVLVVPAAVGELDDGVLVVSPGTAPVLEVRSSGLR